jgi:DNA-binding transcriptional MocR family regulator
LTQKGEALTKAGVAAVIGITARTVQRHLRQLEFAGYIMTQTARNGLGSAIGLVVDLTEAVLPTFMRSKPAKSLENGGKPAETIPPSNNRNSSSRDIDAALAALPDGLRAILERLRPRPAG